jgi:hypothetical protein
VTEPRRVLIDWDYGAHGIWWVLTKEEKEAPPAQGPGVGIQPPGRLDRARPWSERLTAGLLDDLQAWNSAWDADNAEPRILQERGRELALRVQDELGTNGWEVPVFLRRLPSGQRCVADPDYLAAQHRVLGPQNQELGILGHLAPGQHHQAAEQPAREQVGD